MIGQSVLASAKLPSISCPPLCLAGSTAKLPEALGLATGDAPTADDAVALAVAPLLDVLAGVAVAEALVAAVAWAAPLVAAGALVAAGVLELPPQASSSVASAPNPNT